jgi:nicotinate-nucleotide adenylyltransferase
VTDAGVRGRVGIFGGTYDPPHLGHLIVASEVHGALGLDRLLLIPAASPPHKRGTVHASAEQRLEMVRLAARGDDRFDVSDLELRRSGASYTVDTLRELAHRHPGAELFLTLGVDQLREFGTWREPDEIARLARLAVVERAGEAVQPGFGYPVHEVPIPRIDISATEVRRRVRTGEPVRYLVPEAVREYIDRERLYR